MKGFKSKDEFIDLERDMKANMLDTSKLMFSLLAENGELISVLGMTHFRAGVCEVWLIPGVLVDSFKFDFYKKVKNLIDKYIFDYKKYHRVEIAILSGWESGIKWAKSLGFTQSHICEAYDTLYRDYVIFTRIKRWQ